MEKIKSHPLIKLFSAVTWHSAFPIRYLYTDLQSILTKIEIKSDPYNFSDYTDYYESEMGIGLQKNFIVFSGFFEADYLPDVKVMTNTLEKKYSDGDDRRVNLDPGYISNAKLILATTKNYSHRIYLGKGIFGDVHMQFHNGSYTAQPWTYPDYKNELNIQFFNKVRKTYLEQLGEQSQQDFSGE